MHSPPFPGIEEPSSTQRAMLTPHHHRFRPTLPHLCCNSSMPLSTPSSQPTGLPSRQPNKLYSTQPTSSSHSLGVEDPSSAQGGIAPSIAMLVMHCKELLSLSIQPVGGGLRWTLYCCTNCPPLSLLPSNIEACALLNASFRCAPAAIFSCRCPTCFHRAPAAIFSCRRPATIFLRPTPLPLPCLCHLLTLPCHCFSNVAATAVIFCYCRIVAGCCNPNAAMPLLQ
jgi:hypothetical protein